MIKTNLYNFVIEKCIEKIFIYIINIFLNIIIKKKIINVFLNEKLIIT